jgi:hypothetical protein
MGKNEFLPFGTASGSNVLTPTAYGQLAARSVGFAAGVAKSKELNTVWRQASVIAATVAQFIANRSGDDVLDDGNMAKLQTSLEKALKAKVDESGFAKTVNGIGVDEHNNIPFPMFGLGLGPVEKTDAYSNIAQFYRVNNSSANKPPATTGNVSAGVVCLPMDASPSAGYFAVVGGSMAAYVGFSGAEAGGITWARIYTDKYKPTAVDMGALPIIGGTMTGEIKSTSANALRLTQGGYGAILRMDANGLYFLQTNKDDPNGNYNDKRSLTISNDTGAVGIGTQLTVTNADFINKVGYTTYTGGDGHNHAQVGGLRLEVDSNQMAEFYYNVDMTGQSAEVALHNKYGTTDSYLSLRNDGQLTIVGSNPQLYLGGSRVGSDGNVFGAAYGNDWLTNWVKSYTFNGDNHPTQHSVSGNQWWYKDLSTGMIFQGGYFEGQNANAMDRIPLNISVPNRLLHVSTIIRNYAQGYETTYNPQVQDLANERDGFNWFHGAQERVIYWMAVGY